MVLMSHGYLENGQFSVYYRYGHKYKHEQIFKNAQLELVGSKKDALELLVSMQPNTTVTTIPDNNGKTIYEDKQRFPLTGNMEFFIYDNEENDKRIALTWVNTELNETYEFTCDNNTSLSDVNAFTRFVYQQLGIGDECQEPLIITNQSLLGSKHLLRKSNKPIDFIQEFPFTFPKGAKNEAKPLNRLVSIQADFFIFIPNEDQYVLQESLVNVDLVSFKPFDHWLSIQGHDIPTFSQPIESRINVNFNNEEQTMVWNYFENVSCYSLLLKVTDFEDWRELIVNFGQCIYETSSQIPFYKSCKADQDYVINAIENNSRIISQEQTNENNDIEDENDSVNSSPEEEETYIQSDKDKEEEEEEAKFINGNSTNEILTMSYKDHSAYVLRGNKLGIYRRSLSNASGRSSLYFSSSTSLDQTISARQAMLYHDESSYLVLKQDNRVAHYDIEQGKIVDEWGIDNGTDALVSLAPSSKFAQITNEPTFIGITSSAVFRIDPRSPEKVVQQQCKRHMIKTEFSSLATSDMGHVLVGSRRGDIRLFDQPGQMAKATLPPLGRSVQSLDVSADGRYVLATCQHYLMLYDVMHKGYDDQQQQHVLGHKKMFGMNDKPVPNLLKIRPEQIMLMDGGSISFTKATFGTNRYNNRNIITSTGPYVLEWDIFNISKGDPYPCRMQKFDDHVVTVTYDDDNIIVVLPTEVVTSSQKYFEKASTQFLFQLKTRKKYSKFKESIVFIEYD